MIADINRFLVLILSFCQLSCTSRTQISHLEDWTTIPKFEIDFDESHPNVDSKLDPDQQLPLIGYNLNLENGTRYVCSIPDIRSVEERSQAELENEVMDHMRPEQIRSKIANNFEVSIRGKCVRKSEGFWVFELCPFKEVRQIHTDGNRELLAFSLGKFYRSSWDENGHLVQEFRHGTDSRSCKAVFSCGSKRNSAEQVSFVEAQEPTPLKYLMKLESSALCSREQKSTSPYSMLYELNSKCIFLNKGWWSYEFCHLAHIRQFHSERVKAEPVAGESVARFHTVTTASFSLGRFADNASDAEVVNNQTKLVLPGDSSSQPYFSQTFTGGSECDLTGKKRETEIRFTCNKNIDNPKFASVKELKTCSYVAEIEVPTLCSHPKFSKKDPVIYNIHCATQNKKVEEAGSAIEDVITHEESLQEPVRDTPSWIHEADQLQEKSLQAQDGPQTDENKQNSLPDVSSPDEMTKSFEQESRKFQLEKLGKSKDSASSITPEGSETPDKPELSATPGKPEEGPTPDKVELSETSRNSENSATAASERNDEERSLSDGYTKQEL